MNHSTKFKEEEKMSQELIAAYVYEHDNGDECWDNIIEFYKTPKGFVKTYTEGYHRTKTVSEVSYQEIEEAMQRAHIEVDARYEHAKKYGWSHPFTRSGCKIIKELDASKAMEEEVALFKYSFGNGDYVFMTEQAASHKLQIGKIVAEYFGSKANSSYYSVMFGDGEIVEIPMTEFENTAKIFKQAAAEYNNGWIPCSERLPEENGN